MWSIILPKSSQARKNQPLQPPPQGGRTWKTGEVISCPANSVAGLNSTCSRVCPLDVQDFTILGVHGDIITMISVIIVVIVLKSRHQKGHHSCVYELSSVIEASLMDCVRLCRFQKEVCTLPARLSIWYITTNFRGSAIHHQEDGLCGESP